MGTGLIYFQGGLAYLWLCEWIGTKSLKMQDKVLHTCFQVTSDLFHSCVLSQALSLRVWVAWEWGYSEDGKVVCITYRSWLILVQPEDESLCIGWGFEYGVRNYTPNKQFVFHHGIIHTIVWKNRAIWNNMLLEHVHLESVCLTKLPLGFPYGGSNYM